MVAILSQQRENLMGNHKNLVYDSEKEGFLFKETQFLRHTVIYIYTYLQYLFIYIFELIQQEERIFIEKNFFFFDLTSDVKVKQTLEKKKKKKKKNKKIKTK